MARKEQRLDDILKYKSEARIMCGYNSNNSIMDLQHGADCVVELNRVSTYSSYHKVYPSGLGRWSYIILKGEYYHKTLIVVAYIT